MENNDFFIIEEREGKVYAVGTFEGEPLVLEMPTDYDPERDDGRLVVETLVEWLNSKEE